MIDTAYRATLFALYQFALVVGIVALPLALATSRLGVTLPLHRLVQRLDSAYEDAKAA